MKLGDVVWVVVDTETDKVIWEKVYRTETYARAGSGGRKHLRVTKCRLLPLEKTDDNEPAKKEACDA